MGEEESGEEGDLRIMSSNSVINDLSSLIELVELDFGELYRTQFGKFYPQKFSISSVVLAFIYQFKGNYHQ